MERKGKRTLTKEKIIGMQVINTEGNILGKVKELSLVVGEPDQALIIVDEGGNETEARWSEVAAAGDVILLKSKEEIESGGEGMMHCPSCGAELDKGAVFCPNCGNKVSR